MKPFLTLLALALVFAITVVITSLVKADRMMKRAPEAIPPYATNSLPPFNTISISSAGGQITLRGWLISPEKQLNRGTVIMVHDQDGNRLPYGLDTTSVIKHLSRQGFYTLCFDLRHSGESGGGMSSFGYSEAEDVIAALKWATRNVPPSPLILYGFGSGTTAIFRALSTLEELRQSGDNNDDAVKDAVKLLDQIAAVMVDSPARDSDAFIFATVEQDNSPLMFWLPYTTPYAIRLSAGSGDKQDYFAWFSSLSYPVMLFGHAHDDYLEESDYRPMIDERFRIHPDRTSAHFLEGSGHLSSFYEDPEAYLSAMTSFFDRWFPKDRDAAR